jgi:hypothetical protein
MSIRTQKILLVAVTLLSAFNIVVLLNNVTEELSTPGLGSAVASEAPQLKTWPKDLQLREHRLIVDPNDRQKYIVGTVANNGKPALQLCRNLDDSSRRFGQRGRCHSR